MSSSHKENKKNPFKSFFKSISRIESHLQLFAVPLFLLLLFIIIQLAGDIVAKRSVRDDVSAFTTMLPVHPYPLLKNIYEPAISAESAVIIENNSKGILYQRNPTFRFSMASTTKIMTALTALDYYHPDDILTVRRDSVEGTALGLYAGEQMRFETLLYAMLLPSANDAAFAIADNYPGGEKAFVAKMNQKAHEYFLKHTHFGDPAGLEDDEDYTTVIDLAQLTAQAIRQPLLVKIVLTKEAEVTNTKGKVYFLENLNQLLGIDGVTGFKTGQTTGAGGVLVTTAVKDDKIYIIVVMRSIDRFEDTRTLLKLIDNNVTYFQPIFSTIE